MAKAERDLGDNDAHFDHLFRGNAAIRGTLPYDERGTLSWLQTLQRTVDREFISSRTVPSGNTASPIFIIGMPRSGTSLVEQVLASHSAIFGGGENRTFSELLDSALVSKTPARVEALRSLTGDDLRKLGESYLQKMGGSTPAGLRFTDKMPANFAYAGLIHLAFPNARIIHVRRNPVDTCLSCFETLFAERQEFSYELGELGRYYRAYHQIMAHWDATIPTNSLFTVSYEDLVSNFEIVTRRLLAHCGLEWEPACLAFHLNQRIVKTASTAQVRQPLYTNSVGKPRPKNELLSPLIQGLGDAFA